MVTAGTLDFTIEEFNGIVTIKAFKFSDSDSIWNRNRMAFMQTGAQSGCIVSEARQPDSISISIDAVQPVMAGKTFLRYVKGQTGSIVIGYEGLIRNTGTPERCLCLVRRGFNRMACYTKPGSFIIAI